MKAPLVLLVLLAGFASTLRAFPSSIQFALDNNTPQKINITKSGGNITTLHVAIANPTVIGVSSPTIAYGRATVMVIPVAHGSTAVKFTDQTGASTTANVATALCGRPDNLLPNSRLLYPKPGSTASPMTHVLYFAIATLFPIRGAMKLHLIVNGTTTLEGNDLRVALPPPGVPVPSPFPNEVTTYMNGTVPQLPADANIQTQVYDDTCQPAILTGKFVTS